MLSNSINETRHDSFSLTISVEFGVFSCIQPLISLPDGTSDQQMDLT